MTTKSITILDKTYSGEELCDVARDVDEAFDERFTTACGDIPVDEYGFPTGTFTIKIVWEAGEDEL